MKLPAIIPASDPSYYAAGGGLVLLAEFSRPATITCEACKVTTLKLKLLSNDLLTTAECDRLMTAHLDGLGWTRLRKSGADICPECAGTKRDICPSCGSIDDRHPPFCRVKLTR